MIARYDGTTDPFWRAFGLIHWDEAGHHSYTETGEDTTGDEERKRDGTGL